MFSREFQILVDLWRGVCGKQFLVFLKGWCNTPPLQQNCEGGPLRFVKKTLFFFCKNKIVRGTITIFKKIQKK